MIKLLFTVFFIVIQTSYFSQVYTSVTIGKAMLLGVVNDTAFIAKTNECKFSYNSSTSDLYISIPLASFSDNHSIIDSVFKSKDEYAYIELKANLGVSIFDLFHDENSDKDLKFEGELLINDETQYIEVDARIYKPMLSYSSENGNSSFGAMVIDLNIFFNPDGIAPNFFSNPVELIISDSSVR